MKNINMSVLNGILTVKIDLNEEFGKSKSKKSIIVASTEGNQKVPKYDDTKIGINVFKKLS